MALIRITTLLLTLAACHLHTTAGAPHKRDLGAPTATMGSIVTASDYTCTPLLHDYCKSFSSTGERTVGLPNPRQNQSEAVLSPGESYYQNAEREFNDFILLLNTQCSDKLGTLLCFFYFPFCVETVTTRPCLSLCKEVTHVNSTCTKELARYGIHWAQHFDCANYKNVEGNPVYGEENCANETQMPWPPKPVTTTTTTTKMDEPTTTTKMEETKTTTIKMEVEETTTTEIEETTTTTEIEVTTTARIEATTPAPTEAMCSPCDDDAAATCPRKCNTRTGVNGKTFVRNKYSFTVRATLNAITTYHCKDALKFTIVERYDLKSSEDCSLAPDIGAIGSAFIAFGQDSSCNLNCFTSGKLSDLSIDKDYLVAGYYRKVEDSCDSVFWELLSGNSLIVSWEEKRLTSGKMDKYINEREC